MKKVFKIVVFVMAIMVLSVLLSRTTLIITRYDDSYWQDDRVHSTYEKTESKLIGGEILCQESYKVEYFESLDAFLRNSHDGIHRIAFGLR